MIVPIHDRARVRSKSFALAIETRRDDGEWTEVGYIPLDTRAHEIAQAIKAVCDAMPSDRGPGAVCQTCRDCTRPVSKAEPCDLCGQTIEQEREDFPEGIPSAGPSSGWRASDEDRDGVGTEYGIMEANG